MSLTKLTLLDARDALLSKKISAVELTKAHLEIMEKKRDLNAYVLETPDIALTQAKISDDNIAKNQARPMEGLCIGIKDLFCTKNIRSTACSRILSNFIPPYESTVTQNLFDAGIVNLGKLNMDEAAMGSSNLTSYFGPVKSPWKSKDEPHRDFVPGGSSGGSAAAVSAHMALAATASDTGGSIRQPASFCGLVGIKPTYGLCSRWGMIAFASSLDQAGPLTRTVKDSALMLTHMTSYDPKDSTSLNRDPVDYLKSMDPSQIKGLKIGIPKEYMDGLSDEMTTWVKKAMDHLKSRGAIMVDISLPMTQYALPTYYIIAPAEASSNLARYDGIRYGQRVEGENLKDLYVKSRTQGFGEEVKRRIMIGTYVLSSGYFDAYYLKAQKVRTLIAQDFDRVFNDVDIILTPTTPTDAFPVDEPPTDPITMYLNDVYTITVNLAGLPGISVPIGLSKRGLPLGVQFIGPRFSETMLLNAAQIIEEESGFIKEVGL